jgi:hypothetical protein
VIPADSKINQILKVHKYRYHGEPIVRFERNIPEAIRRGCTSLRALAVATGIGFGRI